jgi:hypothetical protein
MLRLLCIGSLLGLLLTIPGCTIPKAPGDLSWDSHFYVPFGTSTYLLADMADSNDVQSEDSSGVGVDTTLDQLYFYSYTDLKIPLTTALNISPFNGEMRKPAGMTDTTSLFLLPTMRHRLLSATISSGTIAFSVQNNSTTIADTATATFKNLRYHSGDTLVIKVFLPAQARFDTTINLAGDYITLEDLIPQQTLIRLHSSAEVVLTAQFQTSVLSFSAYTGILDNLELVSDTSRIAVAHPPQGWESVHPTQVDARVHLIGGYTGATASSSINVQSRRAGFPFAERSFSTAAVNMGRDTTLIVHGLADLLGNYPDSISASGTMTMSGRLTTHGEDTIYVTVGLRAPLSFTLQPVHAPGNVEQIDVGDLSDLEHATATVRIWNRLPVGGRVYLVAGRDSNAVKESSGLWADTVAQATIPVPALAAGRAVSETYTEFTVALDDSLIDWIQHPPFYARTDVSLNGSNGDTLFARGSDYVKVQIIADILYHVTTGDQE